MSTGGFSSYNDGLMHFDGIFIRVVIVFFMIVAGTNFTMFYSFSRRGLRAFTEDTEFISYWALMIVAFLLIFAGLFFMDTGWTHTGEAANSAFMTVSALTTTGFVSDDYTMWPAFVQMLLVLLMIIGGCSSSTSSGNKVVRIVVLAKLVFHGIQTRLHANVIKPVKLNRKDLPNDTVSAVSNHMFLFVLITNGEEPALIDLTFMFGILMNVLAGVFSFYKGQRRLAALPIVLAVLCLVVIIL